MQHYLVIGLGKIGLAVANQLVTQGHAVVGVSRSPKFGLAAGVPHVQVDARTLTAQHLADAAATLTHIAIIVSPDSSSEQGYRDSYLAISEQVAQLGAALPSLQRVLFVSSTGVYGQHQGELIDTNTAVKPPTATTAQLLLASEQVLQQQFGAQCTIVRASGIYGVGRRRLLNLTEQLANGDISPPANSWTNRIFDTDLVHSLVDILTAPEPLPLYLATDSLPVPMYTVLNGIAAMQGLDLTLADIEPTTGKRIIGNLPTQLHYPDWHVGYQAIIQAKWEPHATLR